MMTKRTCVLCMPLLCLGLAACGGGGSDAPAATPAPQPTAEQKASATIEGLLNYTATISTVQPPAADAVEPADVEAVTPPQSETDEPKDVG